MDEEWLICRAINHSAVQAMHMHEGVFSEALRVCVRQPLCEHRYVYLHMQHRWCAIQMTNLPAGFIPRWANSPALIDI